MTVMMITDEKIIDIPILPTNDAASNTKNFSLIPLKYQVLFGK
jgi:hypothetical protein